MKEFIDRWAAGAWLALVVVVSTSCSEPPTAPPEIPETSLARGRLYTQWLYGGDLEKLWMRFSPEFQQLLGSSAALRTAWSEFQEAAGSETAVADEKVIPWLDSEIYNRTASFSRASQPIWVQFMLRADAQIVSLLLTPAAQEAASRFLSYQNRANLRLPFAGEWFVFWGGRTAVENYHAVATDQRFAYDFVVARNGRTHDGDPTRNESYFCFGQPILAPASGVVRVAVDGVSDNRPGIFNPREPAGNVVVLDHGNAEFSFLAHLKMGSVAVAVGQEVAAGATIGVCGNSGNSSEPHLHYHLQTNEVLGAGEGLPASFTDYLSDGRIVVRGEPVRGQRIQSR